MHDGLFVKGRQEALFPCAQRHAATEMPGSRTGHWPRMLEQPLPPDLHNQDARSCVPQPLSRHAASATQPP